MTRRMILVFRHTAESDLTASEFVSEFEDQSRLIRSVGNLDVKVAMATQIARYQSNFNLAALRCGYIPPPSSVDYYLADVYDKFLLGITGTDSGGFVAWQRCTSGLHRPRSLAEYALGLGIPGSGSCRLESDRTRVMHSDFQYLHDTMPDIQIIEYQWKMNRPSPCSESWQFPAGSSTADLWRAIADHTARF